MLLRQNVIETFYRETLYLGNLFVGTIFLLDNYQGLITKGLITGRRDEEVNLIEAELLGGQRPLLIDLQKTAFKCSTAHWETLLRFISEIVLDFLNPLKFFW